MKVCLISVFEYEIFVYFEGMSSFVVVALQPCHISVCLKIYVQRVNIPSFPSS